MKIKIIEQHKSISPPCEFELPEFSVLTGKNGSGKTHLLEAISNTRKSEVFLNGTLVKNVRYIGFNGLNPEIAVSCDPNSIVKHIKESWAQYNESARRYRENEPKNEDPKRLLDYINNDTLKKYVNRTIDATKKPYDKLTEDDFADNFDSSFMGQNDFFTAQFALIFKNYHKRLEENNINEYYRAKGQTPSKPILSSEEFLKKFGTPPWDFVNKILLETNIPYEVNSPIGTRIDSNFDFKLKDTKAGFEINSMDLSTGEKVLMSLALAIYNTGGEVGKPDLLLLDEPDAGLHPSMSRMMVNVLNRNIVVDNGIPTVISTHSPTTIIASEGISIYQMVRGQNVPTKVSTQQAVDILSSDVPFLRVSNDRRRQVFVESSYDVNYYELLTNIFSRIGGLNAEPIYLPARTSPGSNCTDVIDVVTNLYKNGNQQVYGIIDWDTTNSSHDRVIVLGEKDRYSIENYLLDPFLMALLFVREGQRKFSDFGISGFNSYSEANNLTETHSQQLVNIVLQDLGLDSKNLAKCELLNGWTLHVSDEFRNFQGHDLESLYKSKYPFLKAYRREDSLKKDVIGKVINDYPLFTPVQIPDVIKRIK